MACPKTTNRYLLNSNSAAGAGGTGVLDSVGGQSGVAYGNFSYDAQNTGAIELDGNSAYVDLGAFTFGSMSVAFWARYDGGANCQRFFDVGSDAAGSLNLLWSPTCGGNNGRNGNNPWWTNIMGYGVGYAVPIGVWQHYVLAVARSGDTDAWVNGGSQYTVNLGCRPTSLATRTNFYLGKSWNWGDPTFYGALSDFQLLQNSTLTAGDARNMYQNQGCPSTPSSVSPPPPPPWPPTPPLQSASAICSPAVVISDPTRAVTYARVTQYSDSARVSPPGAQSITSTSTWYTFRDGNGFNYMPEQPPIQPFACGAQYPVWLRGTHPAWGQGVVGNIICMAEPNSGYNGACVGATSIAVMNCGSGALARIPGGLGFLPVCRASSLPRRCRLHHPA